ncbi:MAG: LapA family protein [Alistipes senegalensis]|nr:LapA family protein [Oxalobacter formigenes]MCM1280608.1 LapA family protein [Alistipes senegalensis]
MKLLSRIVSLILFIVFFGLAVKNTQEASLYFFFGYEIRGPFVLILLGFFAAGSILAVLGMTPMLFRTRRELSRAKKRVETLEQENEAQRRQTAVPPPADSAPPASDTV